MLACTNYVVPSPNNFDVEELVKHDDQSRTNIGPGINLGEIKHQGPI